MNKDDFLVILSASTLLIIIFSTMFLASKVKMGTSARTSSAAYSNTK